MTPPGFRCPQGLGPWERTTGGLQAAPTLDGKFKILPACRIYRNVQNPSVCFADTSPKRGGFYSAARQRLPTLGTYFRLLSTQKGSPSGAAESSAACGGCGKANGLSRRHNRLFGDLIQKFTLRLSLRSLLLRGKAAVAECKRRSKARSMMRQPQPGQGREAA